MNVSLLKRKEVSLERRIMENVEHDDILLYAKRVVKKR